MMKKFLSYGLILVTLAVYLSTSVGFAVLNCSCEGRTEIKLLSDMSLTLVESHCEEHEHHGCSRNHEDNCCTREYLVLDENSDVKVTHQLSHLLDFLTLDIRMMDAEPLYHAETAQMISPVRYPRFTSFYDEEPLVLLAKMRV